jgi:hypothetical protein
MRVLVTGGRDFKDRDRLYAVLDRLHKTYRFDELVEGGARGADTLAREWAHSRGVDVITFWANWTKYMKGAGPVRNEKMMRLAMPDLVVAFPGGSGTADMVKRAKRAEIGIVEG